jgi:acyl-CoA reductase-like NAD-dependent aldehyde dehydrogenase
MQPTEAVPQIEVIAESLDGVALAQRQWAATPLDQRLAVVRRLRHRMAAGAKELAETIPTELPGALHRTVADSLGAEVLPVMAACRFLEREAAGILRTRRLSSDGRPVWVAGVEAEVERVPWGTVLLVGAANYPLLLAGVQTLQALAAGNAVLWKPAPGTETVAFALRLLLLESGLPAELLTVLDARVESATQALAAGVDYVVLTGSAETGKAVLRQLAETLKPSAMELSGCDAVFVLPGADLEHTVQALTFGLRFNGSFTCMAPRRVFLSGLPAAQESDFLTRLQSALSSLAPVSVSEKTQSLLCGLIEDARTHGAEIALDGTNQKSDVAGAGATLILRATPALLAMQTDIFAPFVSVMHTSNVDEALAAGAACPYALTASIFGPEIPARSLAAKLRVGNVLINDVVVPTVDPRIAFGGRGRSGFGVTRGAEGLLAMTTPRTVQSQRLPLKRAYDPTGEDHIDLFTGLGQMLYGGSLRTRWAGLLRMMGAAWKLK